MKNICAQTIFEGLTAVETSEIFINTRQSIRQAVLTIALRGQAKNSTDLRDICKLSQTPLKALLKTPLGNIFCGGLAKPFKLIYTGVVNL